MSPRPLRRRSDPLIAAFELADRGLAAEALAQALGTIEGSAPQGRAREDAARALARIAHSAERHGDLSSASRAIHEALRLVPSYADFHYRKASVLLAQQNWAEARRSLDAALKINPRYVAARVERALLDAREGLLGEALETLRRLGEEHPVEQPRAFRQGLDRLGHADWEEAGALLKQALRLEDREAAETIEECHRLFEQGERAAALRLLRAVLPGRERYADLHYLMGVAELEEGYVDDALDSFSRALELQPNYHSARIQFARALEGLGDLAQAQDQVARVLEHEPGNPLALELQERWSRRPGHAAARRAARGPA